MRTSTLVPLIALAALTLGCDDSTDPTLGGPVDIAIQQSLTGQTTSAGTFALSGALTDEGTTNEELTFGGPLDRSPVPVTFRRTLAGRQGSMVVTGSATLTFSSPTAATFAGTWTVESATGRYESLAGAGSLTGSANFGATPPTAALTYTGTLDKR